jgi:hypothetical protein
MLYIHDATFKHRKHISLGKEPIEIPSWGDEGWIWTPFFSEDLITRSAYTVKIRTKVFPMVESVMVKLKSTLIMQGCQLVDYTYSNTTGNLYCEVKDASGFIHNSYKGGIVSIARFEGDQLEDATFTRHFVSLKKYGNCPDNVRALFYNESPLQLDPGCLHSMELTTSEGTQVETAWVDPGFDGVLYVPHSSDTEALLTVTSWKYNGSDRYQGYSGTNRFSR